MRRRSARHRTVRLLQTTDTAGLELFAADYRFKPYYYYDQLDQRRLAEYFYRDLCGRLDQRSAYGCLIEEQLKGVLIFDDLPWDSRLFGIPMAKVDLYINSADHWEAFPIASQLLAGIDELCLQKKVRHVNSKLNTQETAAVHALESHAFRLMDTVAIYSIEPAKVPPGADKATTDFRLREMREEDLTHLSTLSRTAFTNREDIVTRFTADPLLMDKAGDLYAQWLQNSYQGDQADIVFVAEADRRPVGFITCKLPSEQSDHILGKRIGSIPLNAVDPEFRRRGVYKHLVLKALDWFREQGADYVEIRTQIHALGTHRAWHTLNGRLVGSYHVLHQHKDR